MWVEFACFSEELFNTAVNQWNILSRRAYFPDIINAERALLTYTIVSEGILEFDTSFNVLISA